jgi:glutathione S-transferase
MLDFYYASGSPYAWRVWLALEHLGAPYNLKQVSFSAGDLKKPAFVALNPRRKVPVVVDNGFALNESAAIVEYLEDRFASNASRVFPEGIEERAVTRRLIREADEYLAHAMEVIVDQVLFTPREQWSEEAIRAGSSGFIAELARFETYAPSDGFLVGAVNAADLTLYPLIALGLRMERRKPDLGIKPALGTKLLAWMRRVEALPYFSKTYPPHWKES